MDSRLEEVIVAALDALEAGDEVDVIVARYPEYEAELRPILSTAASLAGVRIAHSLKAQAASQQRMLEYAAVAPAASQGPSVLLLLRRLSLAMASLVVILAFLGMSVLYAASETVPGDRLYDAKRLMEDARLSLTGSSTAREALLERYEEERIREIETLLRMERSEEVAFSGFIEAIDGDVWTVAGLDVLIVGTTLIEGADGPAVGQLVEISGVVVNGRVRAMAVIIRGVGGLIVPTPEPELPDVSTAEPTPSGTPTATPTGTPTATITPTPTIEETPGESETSTPTSTPTPTSESNENGNANEGGNENEGGPNSNENEGESNGNQGGSDNQGNRNEDNENEADDNGNDKDNENEGEDNRNRNDDD